VKVTLTLSRKELDACPDALLAALADAWRDTADGSALEALLWKQMVATPARTIAGACFKLQLAAAALDRTAPARRLIKSAIADLASGGRAAMEGALSDDP
jgi:hypothetical protein